MTPSPRPTLYRVRRPDTGQIGEVEEHNLDQAIAMGGEVVDDLLQNDSASQQVDIAPQPFEVSQSIQAQDPVVNIQPSSSPEIVQQPEKMYKVKRPDTGEIGEVSEANLEKAKQMGGEVVAEPDSWGQLAARSAKTIASEVVGSIPDAVSSIYNIPAMLYNSLTPEQRQMLPGPEGYPEPNPYPEQDVPLIPSAAQAADSAIDKATNDYTKTKDGDVLQAGLRTASAVATPGGLSKLGANAATKALGTIGTTNAIGVGSAAVAGGVTQAASNQGYGAPAAIGLGLAAGAGASISAAAFNQMNKRLALASLTGNSPKNINLDAVKAAENQGLDYMNTLVNESKGLAVGEQLVSKTPYFGTRQAKKAEIIDKQYAQAVDQAINDVGKKIVDSDSSFDIGSMIKDTFEKVKESVKNEKNVLYETANSLLPEGDVIAPKNLINAVNDIRKNTKTLVASPDESFVLSYLDKIEKGVIIGGDNARMIAPVPVDMLVGSKISINDIINWDVNASGAKNQLRKIQQAIKKDLEEYGKKNPEWYNKFNEADAFYGKYLGDEALGSNTLRSIYKQENPEKILPSLNKISDFKAIEQSLGSQSNGQYLFNSIKREKLTDLIMGKTINPTSDTISYAGFSKALESPANKELIKYLAGDKYKDLQDFNAYAKAAVRRNQRNPNPSGTASTKTVISTLIAGITGVAVRGSIAGVGAASTPIALGFGVGKLFEWVLNNKKQLNVAIKGAKSIANGDTKAAGTYSQRLLRDIEKDLGNDFFKQLIALSK